MLTVAVKQAPAHERDRDGADGDRGQPLGREGARGLQASVEPHRYRRPDPDTQREPQRHIALHLAATTGRGHLDRHGVERGGAQAEGNSGEHPVRQHRPAGGGKEQGRRAGEQDQGEREGRPPPEGVDDPAREGTHAQLGHAGGSERGSDAPGVVALVVQEQRQHREDAEMAGRPQEQAARQREDVAGERRRRAVGGRGLGECRHDWPIGGRPAAPPADPSISPR